MQTIKDIDIRNKTVVLRADYNVPIEEGRILDDYRIIQGLPTLEFLLKQDCSVVVISHLGRPDGKRDMQYSLGPVARHLSQLVGEEVSMAADFSEVDTKASRITLLENLRFWPEEEANDEAFARQLAELGEVYVQDGFGVVHRAHASTDAVTKFVPSVAGLLLEKEVSTITAAMDSPRRPLAAVLGGAKVSDKIELIERLVETADRLIIGGAMANTFLAYEPFNYAMGKSKYEQGVEKELKNIWEKVAAKLQLDFKELMDSPDLASGFLLLPTLDVAVAGEVSASEPRREVATTKVAASDIVVDYGGKSTQAAVEFIRDAQTIIWNGPLGITEVPAFAQSSEKLARAISSLSAKSIIGGGDTAGFVHKLGMVGDFDWVSTGGGAALDLMAGKKLPGVEALGRAG